MLQILRKIVKHFLKHLIKQAENFNLMASRTLDSNQRCRWLGFMLLFERGNLSQNSFNVCKFRHVFFSHRLSLMCVESFICYWSGWPPALWYLLNFVFISYVILSELCSFPRMRKPIERQSESVDPIIYCYSQQGAKKSLFKVFSRRNLRVPIRKALVNFIFTCISSSIM